MGTRQAARSCGIPRLLPTAWAHWSPSLAPQANSLSQQPWVLLSVCLGPTDAGDLRCGTSSLDNTVATCLPTARLWVLTLGGLQLHSVLTPSTVPKHGPPLCGTHVGQSPSSTGLQGGLTSHPCPRQHSQRHCNIGQSHGVRALHPAWTPVGGAVHRGRGSRPRPLSPATPCPDLSLGTWRTSGSGPTPQAGCYPHLTSAHCSSLQWDLRSWPSPFTPQAPDQHRACIFSPGSCLRPARHPAVGSEVALWAPPWPPLASPGLAPPSQELTHQLPSALHTARSRRVPGSRVRQAAGGGKVSPWPYVTSA